MGFATPLELLHNEIHSRAASRPQSFKGLFGARFDRPTGLAFVNSTLRKECSDELTDGERESYTSGGSCGNFRYRWELT